MSDTIDIEYLKSSHGEQTRQGRCRGCRADFPCQSLLAAREIERLTFERDELARERAKWFESYMGVVRLAERSGQERDEWGGKAATASAEASVFRRQRDEAQQALERIRVQCIDLAPVGSQNPCPWICKICGSRGEYPGFKHSDECPVSGLHVPLQNGATP